MKTYTTIKLIKNNFKTFRAGYCDLQNIFHYVEPNYYNAGVYGWNCDIYTCGNIAITTGYRNMAGKRIPDEILLKYDEKAKEILKDTFKKPFDELKNLLNENRENFINELKNL